MQVYVKSILDFNFRERREKTGQGNRKRQRMEKICWSFNGTEPGGLESMMRK